VDLLSELFNDVSVASTLYGRIEAQAPWAVAYPASDMAGFHVILEGECWLHLKNGSAPLHLVAGDFAVLPHGTHRELRDSPAERAFRAPTILSLLSPNGRVPRGVTGITHAQMETPIAVQHIASIGGHGVRMEYLCGAFSFSGDGARPLLSALPDVIHVPGEKGRMMPWLESHLQAVACELTSGRPGASMVIARLSEVLFVQAVRAHLADLPPDAVGWTAAAHDVHVSRALALVHREPQRDWTIASLGAEVGLSRSSFAARFQSVMGQAPLSYLTTWRMHRARGMLKDPAVTIAQIAERVGYASAAAFTAAFKRETGAAPGAWRRRAAAALTAFALTACAGGRATTTPSKPAVDTAAYAAETQEWRAKRLDAIAGPDGWSTLAGLFWLDSARYDIGSAATNTIVLPQDHTPARFGTLMRRDSTYTFLAAAGVNALVDSARIDSVAMTDDHGERPVVLRAGSVTYRVISRGGKLALRVKDSSYVLRRDFKGLTYFPLDTALRVLARLVPHATPRTVRILNVIGQTEEYRSPGMLEFTVNGSPYRLAATFEGTDTTKYFVIFRDATSASTTYPAGRFMYATPADRAGYTLLDFNRAYNPPCAFTAFATCPLPPAENVLRVALNAGEKRYAGPHGSTLAEVRAR
jgi:AraC family transcriptional regulator, alkane utilization regulator